MFILIFLWYITNALCENIHPPDITLLVTYAASKANYTCVAGNKVNNSAITFITPIGSNYKEIHFVSKYISKSSNQTYDYDFEENDDYKTNWVKENVVIQSSEDGSQQFDYVLDDRWEKFPIITNDSRHEPYKLPKDQFKVSLSVRSNNASIILCNDEPLMKCYWITLNNNIDLKYCAKVDRNKFNIVDSECRALNTVNKKIKLNDKKWEHLLLSKINSNIILENNKSKMINFSNSKSIEIKNMYLHVNRGFWKIHKYKFLSLNMSTGEWHDIGPILYPINGSLCIALYAATCDQCTLSFRFKDINNTLKEIKSNQWEYVRLTVINKSSSSQLQIKITSSDSKGLSYIDEVRQCDVNEQRIISMSAQVQEKDIVSCIALKQPKWKSSNIGGKIETLSNDTCKNVSFIGQNCNIPCSSIYDNNFCNKHIICKTQFNTINTACYCAAGYYGINCNDVCPQGFYGYNCHNICDSCNGYCLQSSGICTKICGINDKDVKGCIVSAITKMIAPPIIINSTLTSITVLPVINNGTENILYQIQYKNDNNSEWINSGYKNKKSEIKETTITNLIPFTVYKIRVVLFSADDTQNTNTIDHIYSSVKTVCTETPNNIQGYYDNLILDEINNKLIIKWTAICEAKIEFIITSVEEMCKVNKNKLIPISSQEYTVHNLYPNIDYDIHIKIINNENILMFNETKKIRIMKTDVPVLKQRPYLINPTLNSIIVQFNSKDIYNANLTDFYEIQSKSEKDQKWKANEKLKIEDKNEFVLSDLVMETLYYVRVVFYEKMKTKKYDECVLTSTSFTKCKDLSSYNLIKDLNFTPQKTEINIKWKLVCKNNFHINVMCQSSWCENSNDFYVNSIDTNYTIKNLIPFTNYTITFQVINVENTELVIRNIKTLSTAPREVRDFNVYSFDGKNISVKFQKPYPPYGILSGYEIYVKCTNQNFIEKSEKCDIWEDYECVTISLNKKCQDTQINIAAINEVKGNKTHLYLSLKKTEQPIISENYNLRDNNFEISWLHPTFTQGKLIGFVIQVKQINTFLNFNNFTEINETYNTPLNKTYNYQLKQYFPPSSQYQISIQGKNEENELGYISNIIVFTSPLKPIFIGNLTVNEWSNYTQKLNLPAVNQETLTKNSSMYLVICDPSSQHALVSKEKNVNIKQMLKTWTKCNGVFWVASSINVNKIEETFHFDENTEKLKLDIYYTISILVINAGYNDMYNYDKFSLITPAPSNPVKLNPAFYSLFLLLLIIPVIGYFIYRKRKITIKKTDTSFEESSVETNTNNNLTMRNMLDSFSKIKFKKNSESLATNEQELPLIHLNENSVYSKLIKICNLSQYIKESLEDGELERQHALFPKGGIKPWEYGMAKENKFKNRYNNLTAYDHSRVILEKVHGDSFSDFINANYIDGYKTSKAYIATQGPKPSTVNDFWRMIWQENVKHIVMLANLVEGEKQKCYQYWPSEIGTTAEYFNISVTYLHTDIFADFEYRTFEAFCNGKTRRIQQLHFTSWPDHGVPQYPQSLVPFVRKIVAISVTTPIVVHCSAGVGRTGTIILCDICLRMAAIERQVDVLKYIHNIREQRANLVDNFDQYKLVHMVLLECLLAPETNLSCDNLGENVKNMIKQGGLQKQMEYLKETAWHNKVMKTPLELNDNYASKNRFPDIIPTVRRMYISRYPFDDEYSDYINAVPVDGFRSKDQFIVTQTPLPHTVKDFWRMIYENNVKVVISLNEINIKDKTCCIFWPLENGILTPVSYLTLNYISINEAMHYNTYHIRIRNTSQECETSVQIIQLKNWKREQIIPDDANVFINIIEETQSLSRQENPLVVTCYDGATACGLYVSLYFLIEKMKLEQICDVCQAVRAIRINRPQFVSHRKQFEFLYNAAVKYVASFEGYSNFESFRKNK